MTKRNAWIFGLSMAIGICVQSESSQAQLIGNRTVGASPGSIQQRTAGGRMGANPSSVRGRSWIEQSGGGSQAGQSFHSREPTAWGFRGIEPHRFDGFRRVDSSRWGWECAVGDEHIEDRDRIGPNQSPFRSFGQEGDVLSEIGFGIARGGGAGGALAGQPARRDPRAA